MTITTPSRKIIDRVEVNFDRAANYHAYYRWAGTDRQAGEVHCTVTHKQALQYLSKVEAFRLRIDPHKSSAARTKILQKLSKIGFTVTKLSQSTHHQYYASR